MSAGERKRGRVLKVLTGWIPFQKLSEGDAELGLYARTGVPFYNSIVLRTSCPNTHWSGAHGKRAGG
jgi:hypothetical protein